MDADDARQLARCGFNARQLMAVGWLGEGAERRREGRYWWPMAFGSFALRFLPTWFLPGCRNTFLFSRKLKGAKKSARCGLFSSRTLGVKRIQRRMQITCISLSFFFSFHGAACETVARLRVINKRLWMPQFLLPLRLLLLLLLLLLAVVLLMNLLMIVVAFSAVSLSHCVLSRVFLLFSSDAEKQL